MTRRRWIADEWSEGRALLRGEQARHLSRVLRARVGMEFEVAAGRRVWRAVVDSISNEAVEFVLLEEREPAAALSTTLLLSVFKFDRMEWAIEKAVELGVAVLAPVLAFRTEKHLAQAAGKRAERWRRIALEAAKQSRRAGPPDVLEPAPLREALSMHRQEVRCVLAEGERRSGLLQALAGASVGAKIALAVGPEGGWTEQETVLFSEEGWRAVTLGPRILRAETAAIAALAVCQTKLEALEAEREDTNPRP